MIDFRYHLVSIVAVFLALSLGLLLGSTELKPYVQKGLQGLSKTEKNQIESLLGEKSQLQGQISSENQFALANAPAILHNVLAGQRCVLVLAPGASGSVTSGIAEQLQTAGATVTGQIQMQTAFFDTSAAASQKLTQIAEQYAQPATLTGTTAQAQASELLANVIMTKDGPGQPLPGEKDPVSVQAVQALAGGGFLTKSGQPWDRATLAVVIIPATPQTTDDTNPESQALVTLAEQLNLAGLGTVVAGTVAGSGPGSAIDVMRAGGRAGHLTSVDDADYPIGQIVVAQSLAELQHGRSGSYGVTGTASAPRAEPAAEPFADRVAHGGDTRHGEPSDEPPVRSRIGGALMPDTSRPGRPRRYRRGAAAALASPAAALAAGTAAACAARAAYSALTRRPPGGAGTWTRTNHRGDELTLLEGPALTVGSVAVSALGPGLAPRVRAALAVAGTGAAAFGGYDDLAGSGSRRGFRGHLGALAKGEVTTGAVKLGGIGATGLVSAALLGGGPADVAVNAGLVAGGANLLNLFDLRPGRALKVALASGTLLAVGARPGPARRGPARRGTATRPGAGTTAGPGTAARPGAAIGPGAAAGPGAALEPDPRPGALRTVAAPLGAAIALLPEDLGERAMLGDAGANALGALLGVAAAASLSRPARLALLAAITGLTAASEVVSFTAVIERTPALRWLDMLGRRPVPAAPGPGRDDPPRAEPREAGTTAAAAPS